MTRAKILIGLFSFLTLFSGQEYTIYDCFLKTCNPLILGFGVEILGTKLKLRKVVRESLVIAHVKVPKNPLPGFPFIAKIQDGRHEIQLF